MILTGLAKDDFQEWYTDKYSEYNICYVDEIHLYAMIIQWLDSVGIYIELSGINDNNTKTIFTYNIQEDGTINGNNGNGFKSRQQATEEAIKLANEIYNKRQQ